MTTLTITKRALPQLRLQVAQRKLTQTIALRPPSSQQLKVLPEQSIAAFRAKPLTTPGPLPQLPEKKTYAAERTGGWVSRISGHDLAAGGRIEIELPFGTPRFITAAQLKLLLKGKRSDSLLKKTGHTWTICTNDLRIDLTNTQMQFRLGPVAVYS